jgi:two-component system sensor histidine kinase/response regulator
VDDNPANLKLLEDILRQRGHSVRSFPLGRLALAAATKNPPDLILLDINMPEMNGYEVCERLKSSEKLSEIPVIFLSALNEVTDKVKAFRSGGVDFISKPFQFEEVHARVETHIKLHTLKQALQSQNEWLEELVAARTKELAEANARLTKLDRSKSEFLNLIAHELRTPLNGLLGLCEVVLADMSAHEENPELWDVFGESRRRVLSITEDALLLTRIDVNAEHFRSASVSLDEVLGRAIEKVTDFSEGRGVRLNLPPASSDSVRADEALLERALDALLESAVKFCNGRTIEISREVVSDSVIVTIESSGKTIPDTVLDKFFDLFALNEASTAGGDLGLGPAVAYRILSLFDASVTVVNRDPPGIRLTVMLQAAGTNHHRDSESQENEFRLTHQENEAVR